MKQFAQKSPHLSGLPRAAEAPERTGEEAAESLEAGASTLRERFDSWLDSINLTNPQPETPPEEPAVVRSYWRRSVTSTDMVRVHRATVRESKDHRHWPQDVVEKFLAADVISRKKK
jgi:hypothetical protein